MSEGVNLQRGHIVPEGKHPPVSSIEDVITFRLQRLANIGERAGNDWSERLFGLSLNEWRLLAMVKARQPSRAGDVAHVLLMDKSQMSRVMKALLERGLIENTPDSQDRRALALRMTAAGDVLYEEVMAEVLRSNERVLAPLSDQEVASFNAILEKLTVHSMALLEMRLAALKKS